MVLRLIGLALFAVGVVLLVLGYNASESLGEEVRREITGEYSRETVWYYLGGAACVIIGGGLAVFGPGLSRRR